DVLQGYQVTAVHADETGRGPPLLQSGQRDADQMAPARGVQASVVALRLDVHDLVAVDEAGDTAQFHGDRVDLRLRRLRLGDVRGDAHPSDRLRQPLRPHRLEQVVLGLYLEGVDGVLLVGRDEDDPRDRKSVVEGKSVDVGGGRGRHTTRHAIART